MDPMLPSAPNGGHSLCCQNHSAPGPTVPALVTLVLTSSSQLPPLFAAVTMFQANSGASPQPTPQPAHIDPQAALTLADFLGASDVITCLLFQD